MKREINTGQHQVQSVTVPADFEADPMLALEKLAEKYHLRWLLAHADDGVIWGELRDDGLHLSSSAFPQVSPPLRAETLQQARLFSSDAELLLWKNDVNWQARLAQDGQGMETEHYDEMHILWGTDTEGSQDGFVLMVEGKEGLRHAPPLASDSCLPVHLRVCHYLAYDQDGQAYVAHSRLLGIDSEGGQG